MCVEIRGYLWDILGASLITFCAPLKIKMIDCLVSIGAFVVAILCFFLGLAGLRASVAEAAGRTILAELGQETIRGLLASIRLIAGEASTVIKAKEIVSVFFQIIKVTGINGIVSAICKNMYWYDWALIGTVVVGQLTIWFASEGAALIAEVIIAYGVNGAAIGLAAARAVCACEGHS